MLLVRSLKGLTDLIPVHFANALTDRSWRFEDRRRAGRGGAHELHQALVVGREPAVEGVVGRPGRGREGSYNFV